jgi:hypothetical protein
MQKLEQHKLDSISVTAFTTLEGVVKQFIKDLQDYNEEDQTYVCSINFVKKLRDALEIPKCI